MGYDLVCIYLLEQRREYAGYGINGNKHCAIEGK